MCHVFFCNRLNQISRSEQKTPFLLAALIPSSSCVPTREHPNQPHRHHPRLCLESLVASMPTWQVAVGIKTYQMCQQVSGIPARTLLCNFAKCYCHILSCSNLLVCFVRCNPWPTALMKRPNTQTKASKVDNLGWLSSAEAQETQERHEPKQTIKQNWSVSVVKASLLLVCHWRWCLDLITLRSCP